MKEPPRFESWNPAMRGAYRKGYEAAIAGLCASECPYQDKRKDCGRLTWSRAFRAAWHDGWLAGEHQRNESARRAIDEYYKDRNNSGQAALNAIDRTSSLERTIATLQMRLRRAGQLLIEEIGADGPESADDTAERAAGVIRRQADAIAALSSQLGNLLAVIHRDGGHYESEYGTEKACADAMQRICDTRARLGAADELAMLVRRLARALQKAAPDSDLPKTAMDYLSIAGLAGLPMRKDTA